VTCEDLFVEIPSGTIRPSNLPQQATDLIGRRLLIDEVATSLGECRAVTLTGVGGVGKTRLALEVGAKLLPKFSDGVWVVDLAPVAAEETLLPEVAGVLRVAAHSGEPLITTVLSRLAHKQLLVILDNCDHLIGPVARFVERVATSAPEVRVLATSREALGISAELVEAVPPLAEDTEAVELFIQRALKVDPSFGGEASVGSVREVCRRLDGIPLAIELAAARARTTTPEQIVDGLERFGLLTGGARTAVEGHRTLQATVAWSYELLEPADQLVFQRLSVMPASFDLEAAEAVAAGDELHDSEMDDALGRLVDQSMLITVRRGSQLRYRLPESLRQFAADRLAEAKDSQEIHDRYTCYWCQRAAELGRTVDRSDIDLVLDAIEADLDHFRTAFAQLLTDGAADACAEAFLAITSEWKFRHPREGVAGCQQLLDHELSASNRVGLLALAAHAYSMLSPGKAPALANQALSLATSNNLQPPWDLYQALMLVAIENGDLEAYHRIWAQAAEAAQATGNRFVILLNEAQRAMFGSELTPELVDHYQQLLPLVRGTESPMLMTLVYQMFGSGLFVTGDMDRGLRLVQLALEHAPGAGPIAESATYIMCASVYLLSNDPDTAASLLRRSFPVARDLGQTHKIAQASALAALVAAQDRDFAGAAQLSSAARRHYDTAGVLGHPLIRTCWNTAETSIAQSRQDLAAARARGVAMPIEELVSVALEVLDRHQAMQS
jgi:predicted ATPase